MGYPRYIDGKPYYDSVHGKPAHECCCGDTTCYQVCGCCFGADARVTTPEWPQAYLDDTHEDLVPPGTQDFQAVLEAAVYMVSRLNALAASQTFDFMQPPYDKSLLPQSNFVVKDEYDNDVTYEWVEFRVAVACEEISGVKYWKQSVTAHVRDTLLGYGEGIGAVIIGRRAWGCCGSNATITWTIERVGFGQNPPTGDEPLTLTTNPQGALTVSNNKCCRSSEIDPETGEFTCEHTGTENCSSHSDDATCIPEIAPALLRSFPDGSAEYDTTHPAWQAALAKYRPRPPEPIPGDFDPDQERRRMQQGGCCGPGGDGT